MTSIEELIWDDRNEAHIARHGVRTEEVEELCFGPHWLLRSRRRNRKAAFGQTAAGRYLMVILELTRRGIYYPVTARNMDSTERRRYLTWRNRRH
jgi:uncharacterized DUF497 family protein